MKASTACLAAALVGSACAAGVVEFPISKRDASGLATSVARGVFRRQTVEESVYDVLPWSLGGAYYTNISVGTPPQIQTVIVDTGSSDLYLDASSAASCKITSSSNSCRGGSFDTTASSSYHVTLPGAFNTSFGDGSTATGDFATDTVYIGDVVLEDVQLGIATSVDTTTGFAVGLMGVGYSYNEATSTSYPNMPEVLRDSGAINSRLYSVFLNDLEGATGTILFGGVDTSKYSGELVTLDLLPQQIQLPDGSILDMIYEFVVAVTGVSSTSSGKTKSYLSNGDATGQDTENSLPVLLDTGSAAWTVPEAYYTDLAKLYGDALDEYGYIACSHQDDDISVTVRLGGAVSITVPSRELLAPVYDPVTNKQNTTADGQPLCTFMVTPDSGGTEMQEQGFLTMGDSMLRSMYVVFDLDNAQISIAQAIANASTAASTSGSGSNIKVVKAGPNGVASAVGSANSGVATAPSNTNSIASMVSATGSFPLSTASSAVGTATGVGAVPEQGQTGVADSGAAASESATKGAASGLAIPGFEWAGTVVATVWVAMLGLGGALVL